MHGGLNFHLRAVHAPDSELVDEAVEAAARTAMVVDRPDQQWRGVVRCHAVFQLRACTALHTAAQALSLEGERKLPRSSGLQPRGVVICFGWKRTGRLGIRGDFDFGR